MRRIVTAALLVSLALFAVACGSDKKPDPAQSASAGKTADKSAEEILRDSQDAFRSARSVRIKGKVVQSGKPIELDMRIARGTGARGSIVNDGVKVNLIRADQRLWLRGEKFWEGAVGKDIAGRIGDRWVLVPSTAAASAASSIDAFTDLDGILDQVLTPTGTLSKGGRGDIRGVPAIGLDDGGSGTLWIAAEGEPYPLRIAPKEGSGEAKGQFIDFAEYNRQVDISAPKDAIENPATLG
jgi:hypothetical protein